MGAVVSKRVLGAWATTILLIVFASVARGDGLPPSLQETEKALSTLFTAEQYVKPLEEPLEYFRYAFTGIGFAAVMIVAIRRVMNARNGEESLGWISGMIMTVALMAVAPAIGKEMFVVCKELAAASGRDGTDCIKAEWKALLVILPGESPAHEVLDAQKVEPKTPPPNKKMTQKLLMWNLFAEGWNNIRDSFASVFAALTSVANRVLVFLILLIPSILLLCGMLLTGIGGLVREILRVTMDVFMPMMIAFLSFSPMRGAATSFVLRYVGIALWPVAWVIWNTFSLSLLVCTMDWVVKTCQTAIQGLPQFAEYLAKDPSLSAVKPGQFAAASMLLPWNLQIFLSLLVAFVSALVAIGTVAAPVALSRMLTQGSSFVGDQLRQAAGYLTGLASTGASTAAPALSATTPAGGVGLAIAQVGVRASGSLGNAAMRLESLAAKGGAIAPLASLASGVIGRSARLLRPGAGDSGADGGAPIPSGPSPFRAPSILSVIGGGGDSRGGTAPRERDVIAPRTYRRHASPRV